MPPSRLSPPAYRAPTNDSPAGAIAQSWPRRGSIHNAIAITSARLTLTPIDLLAGQVVTAANYQSAGTALAGGTHGWASLHDSSFALLRQSTDDAAVTWAGNTAKTFTLTSTYTATYTGLYWVGLLIVASTMPTISCTLPSANVTNPEKVGGLSTAALTATAPNPAATPAGSPVPYCWLT